MACESILCTDGFPIEDETVFVDKDPKCWMKGLPDKVPIRGLVVFGSHDSCDDKHQSLPILDQLENGVRFLDLHLTFYEGKNCVFCKGGHVPFLDVLGIIQTFIKSYKSETVIVYLQDSRVGEVDWASIKGIIPEPMKALFVPKRNLNMELKEARGSMILFAPEALNLKINWGSSLIETYLPPADANTRPKLKSFLKGVIALKLSKDKLIWVEMRLRGDNDAVKEIELVEASDFFIPRAECLNILTFTFVDKTHFEELQHQLLKV